jgi:hypothetical protein
MRMSERVRLWLRNTAAVTFSTGIGFLVVALSWQFCRNLQPAFAVFVCIAAFAIFVTAMYASVTTGAELNWSAISNGSALGFVSIGGWVLAQKALVSPIPHTVLIPLTLSSLTVAATVDKRPAAESTRFYNTSRFVCVVHLLQGMFLFGIVLPSCIAWNWPRPFAAGLICSAFVLWPMWRGCPLTMAENKLRVREGKEIIPPEEGFIKDFLEQLGIPVWGKTIAAVLHGIGICLCGWWGIEWLLSLLSKSY